MSTPAGGGYQHGSVGEEAALLAAAIEEWVRSAKDTFGPLVTTALGVAASKAAGFASGAAAAGAAAAARGAPSAGPASPPGGAPSAGGGSVQAGSAGGGSTQAAPNGTASPGGAPPGSSEGANGADESRDGTGWADGLFGHLRAAAGSAQAGVAGECRYCPICRLLAALRGPRSEVMEHLAEAGTSLLAALRAAIEAHERSWVEGPPAPVEHIDIL